MDSIKSTISSVTGAVNPSDPNTSSSNSDPQTSSASTSTSTSATNPSDDTPKKPVPLKEQLDHKALHGTLHPSVTASASSKDSASDTQPVTAQKEAVEGAHDEQIGDFVRAQYKSKPVEDLA